MTERTPEELAADAVARLTGAVEVGQFWRYVDGRSYRVMELVREQPDIEEGFADSVVTAVRLVDPLRGRTMLAPIALFGKGYPDQVWTHVDDVGAGDRGEGVL